MQSKAPTKRVTIRDLARELGVSDRTVSQALHPRKSNVRLNPKTAQRIRTLAGKRNYRTDTSARAMRTGRFLNLGYFEAKATPTDNPLRGSEDGIHDGATRHGYRVVLIKIPTHVPEDTNPIPAIFSEAHLDALIVTNAGRISPECKEAIRTSGLPVVYLNEKEPFNSIYVDDVYGAQRMTGYLVEQGYREIYYLDGYANRVQDPRIQHYSVPDRISGYRNVLEAAGLPWEVLRPGLEWERVLSDFFKTHPTVDAIFCSDDLAALRLFRVLYHDQISVPQRLAVAGYNDIFSDECPVKLTTMRIPFYEMGIAAAEMAIELCTSETPEPIPSTVFRPELIVNDSTLRLENRKGGATFATGTTRH